MNDEDDHFKDHEGLTCSAVMFGIDVKACSMLKSSTMRMKMKT